MWLAKAAESVHLEDEGKKSGETKDSGHDRGWGGGGEKIRRRRKGKKNNNFTNSSNRK